MLAAPLWGCVDTASEAIPPANFEGAATPVTVADPVSRTTAVAPSLSDGYLAQSVTPLPSGFVDLGSVGDWGPGQIRWFEQQRLFVVRTDAGYVVLSQRSPTRGCRLVAADDLDPVLRDDGVAFADPCHGATFRLDGTRLGGPTRRDMYRYRFDIVDERIIVDTRLIVPGPLFDQSASGIESPTPGAGIVDRIALAWLEASNDAVASLRDDMNGMFVWPLGAFHDTASDVVTVHLTVDGDVALLRVGTSESVDSVVERDVDGLELLRAQHVCADAWAGTPVTIESCEVLVGDLTVTASRVEPEHVVAELALPDGGERVVVLTLDGAVSDGGATATSVLLHIVEAFESRPR